jgi:hypothetical protein
MECPVCFFVTALQHYPGLATSSVRSKRDGDVPIALRLSVLDWQMFLGIKQIAHAQPHRIARHIRQARK